ARRVVRTEPWRSSDPSEGVELREYVLDVPPFQFSHRPVTALNVPRRDYVELAREDVPGDGGESVVLVRESEYVRVEGDGVRKEEAVKEVADAFAVALNTKAKRPHPPLAGMW